MSVVEIERINEKRRNTAMAKERNGSNKDGIEENKTKQNKTKQRKKLKVPCINNKRQAKQNTKFAYIHNSMCELLNSMSS